MRKRGAIATQNEINDAESFLDGFISLYEKKPADRSLYDTANFQYSECALPLPEGISDPIAYKIAQGYVIDKDLSTPQKIVMKIPIEEHRRIVAQHAQPRIMAGAGKRKTPRESDFENTFEVQEMSPVDIEIASDID